MYASPQPLQSPRRSPHRAALCAALLLLATAAHAQTTGQRTTALQAPATLVTAVHDYLRSHFAPAQGRIEIEVTPPDAQLHLAACTQPLRVALPMDRLAGTRIAVQVICPGSWNVYLPAHVRVFQPVLVATQPLAYGQMLGAGDYVTQMRQTNRGGYGYVQDAAQVLGRRLLRPVAAGSMLDPGMFAARILVRSGDHVSLLAVLGSVRVRSSGIALASGERGQRIPVRNSASGRIVQGLVESEGTVEVPQ